MKGISPQQLKVLRIIGQQIKSTGISPTMKEIADQLGSVVRLYAITEHLDRLVGKGFLTRLVRRPRSAVPTQKGWEELARQGIELPPPRNDVQPVSENDVEPSSANDVTPEAGAPEVA